MGRVKKYKRALSERLKKGLNAYNLRKQIEKSEVPCVICLSEGAIRDKDFYKNSSGSSTFPTSGTCSYFSAISSQPPVPSALISSNVDDGIVESRTTSLLETNNNSSSSSPQMTKVEENLRIVYILEKIFDISREKIEELMSKSEGKCPSDWICFCFSCYQLVLQVFTVADEMFRLEKLIGSYKQMVQERVKDSALRSLVNQGGGTGIQGNTIENETRDVSVTLTNAVRELVCPPSSLAVVNIKIEEEDEVVVDEVDGEEQDERYLNRSFKMEVDDPDPEPDDNDMSSGGDPVPHLKEEEVDDVEPTAHASSLFASESETEKPGPGVGSKSNSIHKSTIDADVDMLELETETANPSLYVCPTCPSLPSMDLNKFIAHILFHYERPLRCPKCAVYLPRADKAIDDHWTRCRQPKSVLCPESKTVDVKFLPGKIWRCGRCSDRFFSMEARNNHEFGIHKCRPLLFKKCSECKERFVSTSEMRLHKALEHPEASKFCCYYCDASFMDGGSSQKFRHPTKLAEHVQKFHGSSTVDSTLPGLLFEPCPFCGMVVNSDEIVAHLTRDHKVIEYDYKFFHCPVCYELLNHKQMSRHLLQRHSESSQPQPYSSRSNSFMPPPDEVDHAIVHRKSLKKEFRCKICKMVLPTKLKLLRHKRLHNSATLVSLKTKKSIAIAKARSLEKSKNCPEKIKEDREKRKKDLEKRKKELLEDIKNDLEKSKEDDLEKSKKSLLEDIKKDLEKSKKSLLENMKKDLEKSNKNLEKSSKDLEKSKKDLEKSKKDLEKSNKDLEKSKKDLEKSNKDMEKSKKDLVKTDDRKLTRKEFLEKNGLTCPSCPQLGKMDTDYFIVHLLFHWEHPYKCSACPSYLPVAEMVINDHWAKSHPGIESSSENKYIEVQYDPGAIWKCRDCSNFFSSIDERNSHELKEHGYDPIRSHNCSGCQLDFSDEIELRLHKALEHPAIAKLSCFYCTEKFSLECEGGKECLDLTELGNHLEEKHSRKSTDLLFTCALCGKVVKICHQAMDKHLMERHGLAKKNTACFPCSHCWSILTFRVFVRHNYKHHEKSWPCEECGKMIKNLPEHKFKEHGVVMPGHTLKRCTFEGCIYATLKLPLFRKHEETHLENRPRPFVCNYCGKSFTSQGKLGDHVKIHENSATRPYVCEHCGASFAVRNYLYIHKKLSHEGHRFPSSNKKRSRPSNNSVPTSSHLSSGEQRNEVVMNPLPPPPPVSIVSVLDQNPERSSSFSSFNLSA